MQGSHSICLWRNIIAGPASAMAPQSELEFTWGPWRRQAKYERKSDLGEMPLEEARHLKTCFLTHLAMKWATHNLFHSMIEAEQIYRKLSRVEENFSNVDVILLQHHPSYSTSLFGRLLHFVLGTKSISWWDHTDPSNVWCCAEVKFASMSSTHSRRTSSFKSHVQQTLGLNQFLIQEYTNVLVVNRVRSRKILNVVEIQKMFRSAGQNVTMVEMESLSFIQQVLVVNHHSIVIASHGAAWTWIALCTRPNAILVELTHVNYEDCPGVRSHRSHPWVKWTRDQKYTALHSIPHTTVGPRCRKQNGDGDIVANLSDIARFVKNYATAFDYAVSG